MINIKEIIGEIPYEVSQEQGGAWVRNPADIHNGVDIVVPKFTPIYLCSDSIITRASYHFTDPIYSFGNRVSAYCTIEGKKVEVYTCHLDGYAFNISLPREDGGFYRGKKGDFIGRVGSSGSCIGRDGGVHLHFGLRDYETGEWLKVRDYFEI
jgi:murein DD-endopeptidase MepM/ murein hydrolase activator NlpD